MVGVPNGVGSPRAMLDASDLQRQRCETLGQEEGWEEGMDTDAGRITLRYCRFCRSETTHQVRGGAGIRVNICVACLARALRQESGGSTNACELVGVWPHTGSAQMKGDPGQ